MTTTEVPPEAATRVTRRSGVPDWVLLTAPLVLVLVGAWIYRWVDEDAFINFRIIDNLLGGSGPVFNVGERVEVDSDPLWMFTLAALHGLIPWITLEWLSVWLGLVCTAGGFVAGGRAIQRLGRYRGDGPVFPLGLLMVSSVAGTWMFATSGLEMSMVFLWLGWSFLCLVRVEARRSRAGWTAFLMGLGFLLRPELGLCSLAFLAGLLLVISAPGWVGRGRKGTGAKGIDGSGRGSRWGRYGVPLVAALALPILVELARMAYYAQLVPNTGLAKAGTSLWVNQGFTYLWNLLAPYTLWLPLLLVAPLVGARVVRWWQGGDRMGVVVLLTPLVVSLVDVAYVVAVGGDYMHARLLLPALFSLSLTVYVGAGQWKTFWLAPVGAVLVWVIVCAGWLRYQPPPVHSLNPQADIISNERDGWVRATGNAHPVNASDYDGALSGRTGRALAKAANRVPAGQQRMIVVANAFAPVDYVGVPARSTLPFSLVVNVPAIGVIGYLAGPKVYLFDTFSLANPVGSHTIVVMHTRPGHEKLIGPTWMVARFARGVPRGPSVTAARRALSCEPLKGYLAAITAPFGWGQAWSDIIHSWSNTTMSFSADPVTAARQLCDPPS